MFATLKRKAPLRKCVACQEMKPKRELLRIVRTPEGEIVIDPGGKRNGRGAYLCGGGVCLPAARKQHSLERALKTKISDAIYDQLAKDFLRPQAGVEEDG